jgi:phosphomannomutase
MSNDKKVEDRYTGVFGAYDIRGIVGDDLDSTTVMRLPVPMGTTFVQGRRRVS